MSTAARGSSRTTTRSVPACSRRFPARERSTSVAFTDSDGAALSGGTHYTLTLPKDVPAANFWSLTLYEAENASGLANGQPFPSLGSRDKPVENPDGSTDLHLGPEAPDGKERNWLATVPGRGVLRHSAALRADRTSSDEDLEARRLCEVDVTVDGQRETPAVRRKGFGAG